ncbi:SusC/RagA family TonB-linked outer membrane protein [Parapedobacter tibetensis]|uniref:SusC/RagA family TonB-linked outer membrane protein n=1 Tax=Parapedobacter tibetensis TaxID=2972951 RepID=UPI00214D67A0|nr:SusC/RagA family TonB-linked outer membrane protein [Parapedobacter tibetensis]
MNSLQVYFSILIGFAGLSISHAQQPQRIRVVDGQTNDPVAGATVKYVDHETMSDEQGTLLLAALKQRDDVLFRITAVGYAAKDTLIRFPVAGPITVALTPQAHVLEEVVVSTGYQQLPKERATGSFSYIDNRAFNEQVGTDVMSRLEAVANSVQVDRTSRPSSERLMVRGLNTIAGPTEPLIVLDNFPYEGSLDNINPNDIQDITILKDAAAASIWGGRAGNGVIILTTKKGQTRQPLHVEFNSNIHVGSRPDLFYVQKVPSSDFIDVEMMLFDAGYYNGDIDDRNKPALSPVVELLIRCHGAPPGEQAAIDTEIARLRGMDVRNDFNKYVYRQAVDQQYYLGLRAGTDRMGWNISAGYDRNVDNLHARFRRLNLRVQHTMKPVKGLTLNTAMYYTQSGSQGGVEGYGQLASMNNGLFPYAEFADREGNPLPMTKTIRREFVENEADPRLLDWKYYPLEDARHINRTTSLSSILLNGGMNYSLPSGLGLNVNYQYERQQTTGRNLNGAQSFFARDLVNRYTQIDGQNGLVYIVPKGGVLDLSQGLLQSHNLRGQLDFNRDWGSHGISFIAGSEIRSVVNEGNGNRLYGYNSDILTHGNVNHNQAYPDYISGRTSFIPDGRSLSSTTNRYVAMYSNLSYNFRGRYLFSLSGRQDASNLFGLNINDKWNPLWSTGVSWDLSKEEFYGLDWLPYLKFRWTYGKSGNVNPEMVALTTIQYMPILSLITQTPYSRFNNYANPELRWETVATMNAGIDFRTKNNRINGSLEFYTKRGEDLYGPAPVDYTAGVGYTITRNVASIKARGVDVELNTLNLDAGFQWRSRANLSLNKEWVTDYHLSDLRANRFVGLTNPISGVEGKPVRSIYSYKWAGLDPETGEARGYHGTEISKNYRGLTGNDVLLDDLVYHGSTLPTVFGSLGNTLSYRDFFLTAGITYKFGYYFRRETINYTALFGNFNGHGDFMKRWKEPGDEVFTDVPAMQYPIPARSESFFQMAEPFMERGDHIRLQYINIGYELTKAVLPTMPFKKMVFSLNFANLGLLWKSTKAPVDPDFTNAQSTSAPTPLTWTVGLRVDL